MPIQARSWFSRVVLHAVLILGSLLFLLPLVWMVLVSLKPLSQTMEAPPRLLPHPERRTGSDGRSYPAAVYREAAGAEEQMVALLGRTGATARIELETAGRVVTRTVPAGRVRVPGVWRPENYVKVATFRERQLGFNPILRYARNTLYLVVLCVIGTVFSNSLVAYGFARIEWPGRDLLFRLTLATLMIPFPVLMVPQYLVFKTLGWIGSPKPLWVPSFFGSAFSIFLLRQFFLSLPAELSDAARIDGCSELRIYRDVVLPLSKPILTVLALFSFLHVWNDLLGPIIYLTDQEMYTLASGLQAFQRQHGGGQWQLLMASAAMMVAPVLVVFSLAQRSLIQTVVETGIRS